MSNIKFFIFLLVLSSLLLNCSSDDNPSGITTVQRDSAFVTIFNFYIDSESIDLEINDDKFADNLFYSFGRGSNVWWPQDNKSINFIAKNSNTDEIISDITQEFESLSNNFGVLIGTSTDSYFQVDEINESVPASGKVKVKFINALPEIPSVDIYIGGSDNSEKLVTDLKFKQMSVFIEVDHSQISDSMIVTESGILPSESSNIITIGQNESYQTEEIHITTIAHLTNSLASNKRLFVYKVNTN